MINGQGKKKMAAGLEAQITMKTEYRVRFKILGDNDVQYCRTVTAYHRNGAMRTVKRIQAERGHMVSRFCSVQVADDVIYARHYYRNLRTKALLTRSQVARTDGYAADGFISMIDGDELGLTDRCIDVGFVADGEYYPNKDVACCYRLTEQEQLERGVELRDYIAH